MSGKHGWFWGMMAGLLLAFLGGCHTRATPPVVTEGWLLSTPSPTPFRPSRAPSGTETRKRPTPPVTPVVTPSPTPYPLFPIPYPSQPPRKAWPRPSEPSPTGVPEPSPRIFTDTRTWTLLLLGSDRRARSFRTDVLLFVALRPELGTVTLISFPRDLYVYIPGWRMNRINTAFFRGEYAGYPGGGPQLIRDVFLYNFGLRVDRYVLVDFQGFQKIVDALDGVDVPVACSYTDWRLKSPDLDPRKPENWTLYTVEPGLVHMDGEMALWYVRARMRSSDYHRHLRQQAVLLGLRMRLQQPRYWLRLPQLFRLFLQYAETDLTWRDVLPFLPWLRTLDFRHIRQYRLAPPLVVSWKTPSGGRVLLPRRGRIADFLEAVLAPTPPPEPGTTEVVAVQNASGHPDWDVLASWRLHHFGYTVVQLPWADAVQPHSRLAPMHGQSLKQALPLLRHMGLSRQAFTEEPPPAAANLFADWFLVLGQDYNPCFVPARASP